MELTMATVRAAVKAAEGSVFTLGEMNEMSYDELYDEQIRRRLGLVEEIAGCEIGHLIEQVEARGLYLLMNTSALDQLHTTVVTTVVR